MQYGSQQIALDITCLGLLAAIGLFQVPLRLVFNLSEYYSAPPCDTTKSYTTKLVDLKENQINNPPLLPTSHASLGKRSKTDVDYIQCTEISFSFTKPALDDLQVL